MEMTLEEFQNESLKRKVAKGEKPAPYTKNQKQFAVAFAREALAQGNVKARVLRTLGISTGTLDKWMFPDKESGKFRRVRVKAEAASERGLVMITPAGNRVEGLDLEKMAALLRVLG